TDFRGACVMDRRDKPSHGYRAVHIIAEVAGKPVEIQVRTALQHLWAEVSEKASDVLDPAIKYGGGADPWRTWLTETSELVAGYEKTVKTVPAAYEELPHKLQMLLEETHANLAHMRNEIAERLQLMISWLNDLKEQNQ